jgi:hypothetical protein
VKTTTPILHSVRLKSGGAVLRVLRNDRARSLCREFQADVSAIASKRRDDMAGYAVIAWSVDGTTSTVAHASDTRFVGQSELPDFVRTAMIRHYSADV